MMIDSLQWCENRECVYSGMAPQAPRHVYLRGLRGAARHRTAVLGHPRPAAVDVLRTTLPGRVLPDVRLPQEPHQTR